jgi:hypothetical protein
MKASKFDNAILVVVFNYSNCLNNKEAIKRIYEGHFKKIIFYCDTPSHNDHADVHFVSIEKGYTTHAIFPHLWEHYRNDLENSSGLMYTMDDCIINTHRLNELDPNKVISNYGTSAKRCDYPKLEGWHWNEPHGIQSLQRLFATHELPEITEICGSFSDYFYLPKRFIGSDLFALFEKFAEAKVFLEIAIPTIINKITGGRKNHGNWKEIVLWRNDRLKSRDRHFMISKLSENHFYHPIKFNENSNYLAWIQDFFNRSQKMVNKNCIVITTINPPNGFILDYSRKSNWDLIVVGDSKTPEDAYSGIDCIYLGLDRQRELFPTLYDKIPMRSYTRKMFGYLYAIKHGYSVIYETDDDNGYRGDLDHFDDGFFISSNTDYPGGDIANLSMDRLDLIKVREQMSNHKAAAFTYDNANKRLWVKKELPTKETTNKTTTSGLAARAFHCHDKGFVNLYRVFSDSHIWPRGIPPKHPSIETVPSLNPGQVGTLQVAVVQGLVDNDPDVDAYYRLNISKDPFCFEKNREIEVTLEESSVCPFNTQNTFWIDPEMFYALYLPTTVTFRYTDILRGFVALYQLWKSGKTIKFTGPSAYQIRNEHDLAKDYESEVPMYNTAERVIELLESNRDANLSDVYRILADDGIVEKSEIEVVEEWMRLINLFQAKAHASEGRPSLPEAIEEHRNSVLEPQAHIAAATKQALQMSVLSSGQGFAISNKDIADLECIRDGVVSAWTDIVNKLITVAQVRQRNLLRFDEINMLSLGGDCFSRTVLTRWGLKRTSKLGEHSCPFDLAVTYPRAVDLLIENDFEGFMDPLNLAYNEAANNCCNTRYKINFNHEPGSDYAANNFTKLRTLYNARVSNFRHVVSASKPLFMLIYLPIFMEEKTSYVEIAERIFRNIKKQRQGITSLLVLNAHAPGIAPVVDGYVDSDCEWINIQAPDAGYVWHDSSWFMSNTGMEHEQKVIQFVESHLHRMGLMKSDLPST